MYYVFVLLFSIHWILSSNIQYLGIYTLKFNSKPYFSLNGIAFSSIYGQTVGGDRCRGISMRSTVAYPHIQPIYVRVST